MTSDERNATAAELLRRQAAIAESVAAIEALKVALRDVAAAQGSFTERVAGLGTVEVKAKRGATFKGQMPQLVPELYLALDEAERAKLTDNGVVVIAEQWSRPFHGAVTITLV